MPLPLFRYQDDGAQHVAARQRYGLHDEMGVGKTATAIRAGEYVVGRRGLLVVPAFLRENWMVEYRKFGGFGLRLCKGVDRHAYIAWKRDKYDILITSYELATKWAADIVNEKVRTDFVGFDEAQAMKNSSTQRAKALLGPGFDGVRGIIERANFAWHITGTPMHNDPVDIYTFLQMCNSIGGMTLAAFTKTFFYSQRTAYGSRQAVREDMLRDLQALIRNNSIRRTHKDVGLQLPPIFLTSCVVDGDTQAIADLLREYPGLDTAIERALQQGGLSFLDAQHVATLRRLIGEAKAIPYGEMLLEELHGGADKRVVFGFHTDCLTILRDYLVNHGIIAVLVNGDTSERDRIAHKEAFQTRPEVRVFIGNTKVAGTGLTLTAACEVDMLESDWSPAGNAQAIKRIHRIGQTRNVRARFITLARSFDEVVNRIVAAKTAAIAQVEGEAMPAAPLDLIAQFV